jgi:chromosomal replication initiation ATPase DnaA
MIIQIKDCLSIVNEVTHVSNKDILGTYRYAFAAEARFLLYWAARTYTLYSFPKIGHVLNRDHTSIFHGYNKVLRFLKNNDENWIRLTNKFDEVFKERFANHLEIFTEAMTVSEAEKVRIFLRELRKKNEQD